MLVITSDRGLAGAYSSNAIKEGERLTGLLREQGKEVVPYLVGRKAVGYYRFRGREIAGEWTGFSDEPTYAHAKEIADAVLDAFLTPDDEGGVDEIHIVYTHFQSMVTQATVIRRMLPLEVVEETEVEPEGGAVPASTSSSRRPRRCSTRCCRATSRTSSTPRCSSRPPPSTPPAGGR